MEGTMFIEADNYRPVIKTTQVGTFFNLCKNEFCSLLSFE